MESRLRAERLPSMLQKPINRPVEVDSTSCIRSRWKSMKFHSFRAVRLMHAALHRQGRVVGTVYMRLIFQGPRGNSIFVARSCDSVIAVVARNGGP
jgi:hypothetical protein